MKKRKEKRKKWSPPPAQGDAAHWKERVAVFGWGGTRGGLRAPHKKLLQPVTARWPRGSFAGAARRRRVIDDNKNGPDGKRILRTHGTRGPLFGLFAGIRLNLFAEPGGKPKRTPTLGVTQAAASGTGPGIRTAFKGPGGWQSRCFHRHWQ